MFGSRTVKVKIDRELFDRIASTAQAAGYASAEEFIQHVLERAAARADRGDEAEIRKQLRGLGYIE